MVSEQCGSLPAGLGAALLDATGTGNEEGAGQALQLVAEVCGGCQLPYEHATKGAAWAARGEL